MRTGNIPEVSVKDGIVAVKNEYWEVIHDKSEGGAISSIRFFNGTGRSLLRQPLHAHVARREHHSVVFYKQRLSRDTTLEAESKDTHVEVRTRGHLHNDQNNPLPVEFEQVCQYRAWGLVKVELKFTIEKPLEDVCELSPCGFYLAPSIDTLGLRPSISSHMVQATTFCRWKEVGFSHSYKDSRDPVPEQLIPIYFCAFQKGVEGLEFYRGGDSDAWNRPYSLDEEGQSIFTHERALDNGHFHIRCESFCDWNNPRPFAAGSQKWEYYLGLPFVKKPEGVGNKVFHAGVNSDWLSDEAIGTIAQKGIKLLRHHDDNTHKPKAWPDGKYPPYAPEDMRELDRVIATAHRNGMKITPYFSLKEFHPSCPEYSRHAQEWKRRIDKSGMILGEDGPFGGYMCMKSEWLAFRKKSIDLALEKHPFDGVYYDHMWFHTCRHPDHCGGHAHTDVDEVLDFYFWTRKRIGDKGFMFIHCSGTPSMVAENMADLVFVSEDVFLHRALPGNFDPLCEFVPITPRHTVPGYAHDSSDPAVHRVQHLACFLEGWPTSVQLTGKDSTNAWSKSEGNRFVLGEIAKFAEHDLSRYMFIPARRKPIITGDEEVYASVHHNSDALLVYLANFGSAPKTICPHPAPFLEDTSRKLLDNGPVIIEPYSSKLLCFMTGKHGR